MCPGEQQWEKGPWVGSLLKTHSSNPLLFWFPLFQLFNIHHFLLYFSFSNFLKKKRLSAWTRFQDSLATAWETQKLLFLLNYFFSYWACWVCPIWRFSLGMKDKEQGKGCRQSWTVNYHFKGIWWEPPIRLSTVLSFNLSNLHTFSTIETAPAMDLPLPVHFLFLCPLHFPSL